MRIVGVVCSPRKGGNTEIAVGEALNAARAQGAEVELVTVAGKDIKPCDGCESCRKTKTCKYDDDAQRIFDRILAADGVIFGSPTYFWSVTAQAKALIDRTYQFREGRRLRNKVAGAVVVARRAGAAGAFMMFNNFFAIHRMINVAGAVAYGNDAPVPTPERGGGAIVYGGEKGDVTKDAQGMGEAWNLGAAMAQTVRLYKEKGLI